MPKSLNARGFSSFAIVSVIAGLTAMFLLSLSYSINRKAALSRQSWDRFVASETTKSAFVLLQAALKRRMWEPPPDANCMRRKNFGVSYVSSTGGIEIDVQVNLDTVTGILTMSASNLSSSVKYQKSVKIIDTSDFIAFSADPGETVLGHSAVIGNDRRLFYAGKVKMRMEPTLPFGNDIYPRDALSWTQPAPMMLPQEISLIFQSERMTFLGGLTTMVNVQLPPSNPSEVYYNMFTSTGLMPASGPGNYTSVYFPGPYAGGAIYFTNDYNEANTIYQGTVNNNTTGFPPRTEIKKRIYPVALFNGALPLKEWNASDTGSYFADPDQMVTGNYTVYTFPKGTNMTCVTNSWDKSCNDSAKYKKGFTNWRKNASLDTNLLTFDGFPFDLKKMSWDNYEALEEDASACGVVVTAGSADGSYEFCDFSSQTMWDKYKANPSVNPCETIYELDTNLLSAKLNNFAPGAYSDITKKGEYSRRVIYSTVPLRLKQTDFKGLWPALVDNNARMGIPLWVVNEYQTLIQPAFDSADPGPLVTNPNTVRKVYFNGDGTGSGLAPINLVFVSPEQFVMVSPNEVPYNYTELKNNYPVASGRIKPKLFPLTDHVHQNDDAFKWGYRDTEINNTILISNYAAMFLGGTPDGGNSSILRTSGFWGNLQRDWRKDDEISFACMMDFPGDGTGRLAFDQSYPTYSDPTQLPPPNSRFWQPLTSGTPPLQTGTWNAPYVFDILPTRSAEINFSGISLGIGFDSSPKAGKRDLSTPRIVSSGIGYDWGADLSDRRYTWTDDGIFQKRTDAPCRYGDLTLIGKTSSGNDGLELLLNPSYFSWNNRPPANNFRNTGAVTSRELPIIQVGN